MLKVMKLMVAGLMVAIIALTTVALPSYAEEQPLSNENIQPFSTQSKTLKKDQSHTFPVYEDSKYELMVYNGTDKSGVFEYKLMNPLGTKAEGTVGAKKQTVVPDILTENHVGFEVKNTSSQ
jgi:hypothetical protein